MKKTRTFIAALLLTLTATAFKIADDIITRLGMQHQAAQANIISNLVGRFDSGPVELGVEDGPSTSIYMQAKSFRVPYARLLVQTISGDKTGAAKDLCEYVKKFVNSEEFMLAYQQQREEAIPLEDRGMSLANLKKNIEVYKLNMKNYANDTKYVSQQQQLLNADQKRIDALTEIAKNPFPGKDTWEKTYPNDPTPIVKKRLQEYLQLVATVDFNAKLTGTGKRQTFVNPVYEKKSLKWKAIYRAGKEVNDVVTVFVKEWLKGPIISTGKTKMTAAGDSPAPEKNIAAIPAETNPEEPAAQTAEPVVEKKTPAKKAKSKLVSIIKKQTL
jgi:hypothetical protein